MPRGSVIDSSSVRDDVGDAFESTRKSRPSARGTTWRNPAARVTQERTPATQEDLDAQLEAYAVRA